MNAVVHVIAAVGIHNIDIVRVAPRDWPGIYETERVATILEAAMIVVATVYVEAVPAAKACSVVGIGDAAVLGAVEVTQLPPGRERTRYGSVSSGS